MSHHNVQYECIQCLEKFSSRKLMYEAFNFCFSFFIFKKNILRSEHQEATQHTGEGIIENLESETNVDESIVERVGDLNQTTAANAKSSEVLDDVFDEMDNIEETAAKVLYGLQNMDRTESPQSFSVSIGQPTREINSEFLNYTNFIQPDKPAAVVSIVFKKILKCCGFLGCWEKEATLASVLHF